MTLEPPRRIRVGAPGTTAGIAVLAALVAAVLVAAVIDPFGPSLHDPDAAASVLYFDRIVAGQRLEAFVPTTPKPLLTLLYGASWALTGDWRVLGLWTLVAYVVAVAASTALLRRIGGWPAAAFAAVALVASPTVIVEVAGANSLIWGLAGWAVAPAYIGLGFSLRGTAICNHQFGTLASPETFGKCHSCGEEIAFERLDALPHARYCIKCKQKEEDAKK